MAPKVVLTHANSDTEIDDAPLRRIGARFQITTCGMTEDDLIAAGADADAMIILGVQPFTRRVIERLEKCRVLAVLGIGYDGVDVASATELGVCVSNNPYYCLDEVSDHAMSLVLACARKVVRVDRAVRAKQWRTLSNDIHREVLPPMSRLRGQTLGIIGFGNIARTLLPKAKGFGLGVIAHDPYVPAGLAHALGVELVDFDRVLAESDFITLHAALTTQNRNLMGIDQFRKMKPSAYLINTSRGGLIDEQALYTALTRGYIAGAGLDVTEQEPLALDSPLMALDNVILTAHAAYYSDQANAELWTWPVEEAARVLRGEWPQALVNPAVKERFAKRWGKD
ncbi:MAG: C-terminal binding protein [Chloroflexi bacterium]|nr:C-terminal binding protein [Chloroflexota bacterium]